MNIRRTAILCIGVILAAGFLNGCGKRKEPEPKGPYIYYVNTEGTALVKESYELKGDSAADEIEDVLKTMKAKPDSIEYKSVFPKGVEVKEWELEDSKLHVCFNQSYLEMDEAKEVLLRAAVVQSLVQIKGVDYVEFSIEGQPLTRKNGEQVGYMRADDFVQNIGYSLHSYQKGDLRLYFADDKGSRLEAEEVSVRYNSNLSIEKLIVEQLIKGPKDEGHLAVIPPETKVLGVSVKDNICYINLDENFLNTVYGVNPQITVYAIVNSVVEGGNCGQVQISVNGESDIQYMDSVDLSRPLSRDLDLTKEAGE